MMNDQLRYSLRIGTVFGIIVIFLVLIGFTMIGSTILADLVNAESTTEVGNTTGLMIFMGLLGLWAGAMAARGDKPNLISALLKGTAAGLTTGIITFLFTLLLSWVAESGLDIRKYLVQLSPDALELFFYGGTPTSAAVRHLGILTASGFLGGLLRFILNTTFQKEGRVPVGKRISERVNAIPAVQSASAHPAARYFVYGLVLLIVLLIPQIAGQYWNFILGTVGIYVIMGLGLNIVVGLAGLLDLGYVAFFAVGAYTIGLLTAPEPFGIMWNFWTVLPIAVLFAAMAGILLGLPVLRLRGDYLAIVTLGFGEIIRILVRSDLLSPYTGGPQGVRDIAGPTLFGIPFSNERNFMYLIILGILLVIFVTIRMQSSRVGRAWIAMREDETVAQAMGINTYRSKLLAFAIGAAFAGLGGLLFASRNQYTGPEDHNLLVSINVLSLVIVGGMGSIPGVILGAFALKGLPEILRQLEDYRILAFGALLVVMMIWRPEGLWPSKRRRLEMHDVAEEEPPEPIHPRSADLPELAGLDATTDVTVSTNPSPEGSET